MPALFTTAARETLRCLRNKTMLFQQHPSSDLVALYQRRPFQGQVPEKASIIFLSSDANYSPEISRHSFFARILEYHADGVSFWKRHGCHHPFLHPEYPLNRSTGGVPFHRNFSKLGLGPDHADHIAFLELLDVPTIGNRSADTAQYQKLLLGSLPHLEYLSKLMMGDGHRLFFVARGVMKDMAGLLESKRLFPWLYEPRNSDGWSCGCLRGNAVKEIFHFSSAQIHGQLREIRTALDGWLTGE